MTQPISALKPNGASDAGSTKMPMPMTLPTTSAVQVQSRSCCRRACWVSARGAAGGDGSCSCGFAGGTSVGRAQQVLEMPDAALALRVQPAGHVVAGGQAQLHRLADRD